MDKLSLTRRATGEATSARDQIFAEPAERVADFDFGAKTAAVFDDMLGRSVPFYDEI
jgi:tRNA (cmo5U34)-methyltransferase